MQVCVPAAMSLSLAETRLACVLSSCNLLKPNILHAQMLIIHSSTEITQCARALQVFVHMCFTVGTNECILRRASVYSSYGGARIYSKACLLRLLLRTSNLLRRLLFVRLGRHTCRGSGRLAVDLDGRARGERRASGYITILGRRREALRSGWTIFTGCFRQLLWPHNVKFYP